MKDYCTITLLADDVQKCYTDYRIMGKSRNDAIAAIKSDFAYELQDSDDCMSVLGGLVFVLAKKKELIESIANEAENSIATFHKYRESDDNVSRFLSKVEQILANKNYYGSEAHYGSHAQYIPDWKTGDLFSHTITNPIAAELGISGWTVLFYKVGDHTDEFGKRRQLMLLAVCPPEKIPACSTELQEITFLRTMCHDKKWNYLFQIIPKNRRDEQGYELTKIGNYPDILLPADRADENPLVAMPIWGRMKKSDIRPAYEDQICRLYKRFIRNI